MWDLLVELVLMLCQVMKSVVLAVFYAFIPAPEKSVSGEVVLITGAGSGIGQLMAVNFAKRGAIIVAWDINKEGNEQTAQKVKSLGGKIYTYICDVSKKEEVYKVAERVKSDIGDVTILVNNAGIVSGKNFLDCRDDQLVRTMEINVLAHFWTLKSFLPSMVKRNHGHVVTIASMAGIIVQNGLADYCASKFANVGFTGSLALELAHANKDGIHTTTICPYTINTGMFEGASGRFPTMLPELTPEYAASRIVKAVVTNQTILYMPRSMYGLALLSHLLPVDASQALHKFFGGLDFMQNFVGRQKKD